MKRKTMPGTAYRGFPKTSQGSLERVETILPGLGKAEVTIAKVVDVHTDRMTVDVISNNGLRVKNVQLMTKGGLENGEIWGEMEVPSIDQRVVVAFLHGREDAPFVIGTIFPYNFSKYQSGQTAVNSDSKQFTTKLLEDVDPKAYRRIFKSGTTVEVKADGTITIETPSGTYFQINEDSGDTTIEDQHGNTIVMSTSNVTINGNLEVLQ